MKRKIYLFIILVSALTLFNCEDDDVARKYDLTVQVSYPQGYTAADLSNITVKVVSTTDSYTDEGKTDANGEVVFSLSAGVYDFSATIETTEFAFNGVLMSENIAEDLTLPITLTATSLQGGLIFKEIYFSGSKTPADASYYSDQFHEIYNNSDETIYLDNLCIGHIEPSGTSASVWVDGEGELLSILPLTTYSWYIAGSGTDYPLAPRTSIIIAQDGIDHQTDPNGNPNSPVNLGNADWETYCGDINNGKDADAAGVPNLTLLWANIATAFDWMPSTSGAATLIFRFPEGTNMATWVENPENLMTKPGATSTREYLMLPSEYVIDAVEIVRPSETQRYKRLPNELDAGKVWCSSSYNAKSIRRKVKQIIDGKVIYKDTNNSSEDFLSDQDPTPGVNPTAVDE